MTFIKRLLRMASMSGRAHAITVSIMRLLPATSHLTWLDTKTWTNTVPGVTRRVMDTYGFRAALTSAGRPITTATGSPLTRGDGPGLKTSPGATLRSTMAVGSTTTTIGDGHLVLYMSVRTILRPWSHGLAVRAGALESASAEATATDGAR